MSEPLLTVADCAERLNVCVRTVRKFIERGELLPVTIPSGQKRITRIDPRQLEQFIAKHQAGNVSTRRRKATRTTNDGHGQ